MKVNKGKQGKGRKAETVVYADAKDQAGLDRLAGTATELRVHDNGDTKHASDAALPQKAVLVKVRCTSLSISQHPLATNGHTVGREAYGVRFPGRILHSRGMALSFTP
jgi:hypothetical protein